MTTALIAAILVVIAILVICSALFSAIETALFSLQPHQLRSMEKMAPNEGPKDPALVEALSRLMENPRSLLSTILLADVLVNLPLIILCLFLMLEFLPGFPFAIKALLLFAIVVLFCDLLPKLVALRAPYRIARIGIPIIESMLPLLEPLSRRLQDGCERIADALTPKKWQPHKVLNEDEIETLVQLSAEEGALQATESEMIQEIIKLSDKTVKDVMTPRVDAFFIPDDLTHEEALAELRSHRQRRVPVYGDTPDDIIGVIDVRRLLLEPGTHYTEALVPPSFVPETMRALDLLKSFLTHPQGIAIVVDEFGGMEGVVTLTDIVEEIISDAVPSADQKLYIEALGGGRILAAGLTRLDDLSELGVHFQNAEGIDTIGGLVFNHLGQLPRPGVTLEIEGYKLTVRRVARSRIAEVMIDVVESPEEEVTI